MLPKKLPAEKKNEKVIFLLDHPYELCCGITFWYYIFMDKLVPTYIFFNSNPSSAQ